MSKIPTITIVDTDFGTVRLSDKVLGYLNSVDPDWNAVYRNGRRRGKHAQYVRQQVDAVTDAVLTLAKIEWAAGGHLVEL